jgi:glycosyltransferase involved in cell wall biosynthesis
VNKNLERSIQALSTLNLKSIILGKLTEGQKELLEKYNMEYTSYFNVPYSVVAELYHQSDVVCFASLYEGFGVPILEAQMTGRPVVTSNLDPMRWVAGEGASLADPQSVEAIRDGVRRVLKDEVYRCELVRKGQENLRRFEPGVIARMYGEVYESLGPPSLKLRRARH